jgi:hypothetical protein
MRLDVARKLNILNIEAVIPSFISFDKKTSSNSDESLSGLSDSTQKLAVKCNEFGPLLPFVTAKHLPATG